MRRFVVGDIHANFKALKEVFEEVKFDYKKDFLIIIGDVVDGYNSSYEVVEELLKIKNKVFIIGNHDCINWNTEVLTDSGWVKAKKITDEKIANFSIKTGTISYDYPISIIPPHKSKGILIEGYNHKQHITPNHDVVIDNKKMKAKDFSLTEKIDISRFRHFGKSKKGKLPYNNDWIRLLTWVICDGCIYSSSGRKKRIQFKLSKPRKIKILRELLDKMKLPYTFQKATKSGLNKLQPYMIRIYGNEARDVFQKLDGKKKIPKAWQHIGEKGVKVFLDTLKITDGHVDAYGKTTIVTTDKSNANIIQSIMISNGKSCAISNVKKGSGFSNGKCQYLVSIYDKIKSKKEISISEEEGTFMCFTMPKGTLITRLDGKVAFTGNCWWMNHMSTGWADDIWLRQGGEATLESYKGRGFSYEKLPDGHKDFFSSGVYYYELDDMMFVHGGFDYPTQPKDISKEVLTWDRSLIERAKNGLKITEWKKVFVGHTTTENDDAKPSVEGHKDGAKVINVDCGAGWRGRLCLWNIDTDEFVLSKYAERRLK